MCLIVVKPLNIELPKINYLRNGFDKNGDGCGLAYLKKDENIIHIIKGFKVFESLEKFIKENITPEDILIVHFRLATHGLTDEGNCHPFPVTSSKTQIRLAKLDCKMAVAHNGIISQFGDRNGTFSDTQQFVLDILSNPAIKNNLDNPAISSLIGNYLGRDRLVVLDHLGEMWMFGDFEKEDGCLYSNIGFRYPVYSLYKTKKQGTLGFSHLNSHYNNFDVNAVDNKLKKKVNNNSNRVIEHPCIIGSCEGCFKDKGLIISSFKGTYLALCKKCRKRVRKGTFSVRNSSKEEIENIVSKDIESQTKSTKSPIDAETRCSSCREFCPTKDLKHFLGELICPKCNEDATRAERESIIP